jgi:hypothetical protein
MNIEELRKSLGEGLKADTSGKTTPMQRLTPFLSDLVNFLEERETSQVSSDAATRAVPAQTKNESDDASKATA